MIVSFVCKNPTADGRTIFYFIEKKIITKKYFAKNFWDLGQIISWVLDIFIEWSLTASRKKYLKVTCQIILQWQTYLIATLRKRVGVFFFCSTLMPIHMVWRKENSSSQTLISKDTYSQAFTARIPVYKCYWFCASLVLQLKFRFIHPSESSFSGASFRNLSCLSNLPQNFRKRTRWDEIQWWQRF